MFKKYRVKNPTLSKVFTDKWLVRQGADASIPADRLVEYDVASGNIKVASLDSVRVVGANQDNARVDGDFFDCEIGVVNLVAGSPLVAGQKVKAGTGGKAIAFIDSVLANDEIATGDGGGFTNQPANDSVTVVSDSTEDVTQTLTVYGIDNGGAFVSEEFALNGTTDVDSSVVTDWATIVAVELDAPCVGSVELSETSGGLEIVTLAASELSAGIVEVTDGYAYNKKATVVADGASTAKVVAIHKATDGAADSAVIATLNGATEVIFDTASYVISKVYVGAVASDVNVDVDITGTVDSDSLAVGRVLQGATVGADAIVNIM